MLPEATAALTVTALVPPVALMVMEPPAAVTLAVFTVTVRGAAVVVTSTTSKPETLVSVVKSAALAPKFKVSVPEPPSTVSPTAIASAAVTVSSPPAKLML